MLTDAARSAAIGGGGDDGRPAQPRPAGLVSRQAAARKFEAFGVERSTFVSSFTEGLELMKAAWSDEPR